MHAAQSLGVNPTIPSSLMVPLLRLRHPFVLANPRLPDAPIVHASPMFLALTQYSAEQVVGRNCRFLQGAGTAPDQVMKVREAVQSPCPYPVTVSQGCMEACNWSYLRHIPLLCSWEAAVQFLACGHCSQME